MSFHYQVFDKFKLVNDLITFRNYLNLQTIAIVLSFIHTGCSKYVILYLGTLCYGISVNMDLKTDILEVYNHIIYTNMLK